MISLFLTFFSITRNAQDLQMLATAEADTPLAFHCSIPGTFQHIAANSSLTDKLSAWFERLIAGSARLFNLFLERNNTDEVDGYG